MIQTDVRIVEQTKTEVFEREVRSLLENGWQIHSSSCGFANSEKYDFGSHYQAIMVRYSENK